MFRHILVRAGGDAADAAAWATALTLARRCRAHLEALHARPDPVGVAANMGESGMGSGSALQQMMDGIEQQGLADAARARTAWLACCATGGFTTGPAGALAEGSAEFIARIGDEADWLVRHGRTADLVVLGRSRGEEAVAMDLLQEVLVGSGRPLLIVPTGSASAETGPPLLGTVAIAWKDSAEAARAVGAATSLIGLAEQVLVLTVGEEPTAPDSTGQSVEADSARLVRTLQRHNPAVRAQHLPPGPDQPVEALLRAAVAAGAGLLVMGGYGHGRLREAVFGGFTQQVLRGAPMAVLMMH